MICRAEVPLIVSFSGGKSSACMARKLQQGYPGPLTFLFANTGQEKEETLAFVNECDVRWGLSVVWVEAKVNGAREGTTHRVVDFETASRNGRPFEQVIEKYGIPNKSYPHCTRELKLAPMNSYLRGVGIEKPVFAIGIRVDEPKRLRKDAESAGITYPLAHWFRWDKQDVNAWWEDQSFGLQLAEHEGNCSWCWKKSLSKHLRLIGEAPGIFDFPRRMEAEHSMTNARHGVRVFFRENRSTKDLFRLHAEVGTPVQPVVPDEDAGSGCSESCDINMEIAQ